MSKTKSRATLFATIADDLTGASQDEVIRVPLSDLQPNPRQPRRYFDSEALAALITSVRERGVLQPLLVRPLGQTYEIIAGERRYRAAQLAGHTTVPVVVRKLSGEQAVELALIENLQREDLNPVEETEALVSLYGLRNHLPQEEVASRLQRLYFAVTRGETPGETEQVERFFSELAGMNWKSFVNHRLPLLKLPKDVLEALREGRLEYTKAREIAKLKDVNQRKKLLKESIDEVLPLKDVKRRVRNLTARPAEPHQALLARVISLRSLARKSAALEQATTRKKVEVLLSELEALLARQEP